MVKYPNFKLIANGSDITQEIKKNLIELSFSDEANNKADSLSFKVAGEFTRPNYKDELKLYIGYDELVFFGLFIVQNSVRNDNNILSINATSVDFSQELKRKRDVTYENISVKDICNQISMRHSLKVKSDYENAIYKSKVQHNESDINFLNRLAKELNAIFNIKNNTLIFLKKIKNDVKNNALPSYTISSKNTTSIQIKHSNKTLYASCKAVWHDTKENKSKEIVVGNGEPCLIIQDSFLSEAEAKTVAESKLQLANQGIVSGSITKDGDSIYAGGVLNIVDTLEDDGEYQIKSVKHTLDGSGWIINIEFER